MAARAGPTPTRRVVASVPAAGDRGGAVSEVRRVQTFLKPAFSNISGMGLAGSIYLAATRSSRSLSRSHQWRVASTCSKVSALLPVAVLSDS